MAANKTPAFTKTKAQLDNLVLQINLLAQQPVLTRATVDDKTVHNVGNYHLEKAHGGYCLRQIVSEQGGDRNVLNTGFVKANTMYELLHAYRCGFEAGKEQRP